MTQEIKKKRYLKIDGGQALFGSVRVGGAKNASYKLMIASLLAESGSRLLNLPKIADVMMVEEIIKKLGANVESRGERALMIEPEGLIKSRIEMEYGEKSRASTLFLPVLLQKLGEAWVPNPGGDKIGARPLERHFLGLKAMGAKIEQTADGWIHAWVEDKNKGLHGANYKFSKNTHTGTETLIMASVLADGITVLENAATEPEVDDLINFLNQMGAKIKRQGEDGRTIVITGVKKMQGTIYKIMPDRNEVVTYACAAIASGGDVVVENAREKDLKSFVEKLREIGAGVESGDYGIRFYYRGELKPTEISTSIHPGFMTDWQPLWATLVCHANGESIIHETVMQNRFQYVEDLQAMGAKIEYITTEVKDWEKTYNFNYEDEKKLAGAHAIKIIGPTQFRGGKFEVRDLRAGATLILAALSANSPTILTNIEQIERGYENLVKKMKMLGAKMEIIEEKV